MPQNRISICTSRSVGSRRGIWAAASGEVLLVAAYALDLYMGKVSWGIACSEAGRPAEPDNRVGWSGGTLRAPASAAV
jgi:hypothetical protein